MADKSFNSGKQSLMSSHVQDFLSRLKKVKPTSNSWDACCPAHDDTHPSLGVAVGKDGHILLLCRSQGCSAEKIVGALGVSMNDLFASSANAAPKSHVVVVYDYRDEEGNLLFQVVRRDPKGFFQRRPDGKGGWINNLKDVRRVLYRLQQLHKAPADQPVFVVEGEKDADNLSKLALVATTNPGGAGKWRDEFSETLRHRCVVVLPDNDDAGRQHGQVVAASLHGIAASVRIIELPGLPEKGDVSDWLQVPGNDKNKLLNLIQSNSEQKPAPPAGEASVDHPQWPKPMSDEAFHGLAGQIVQVLLPHSEADPAALLGQLLIGFGNAIGRTAHFAADGRLHFCNEFMLLIGPTASGRKGASWSRVARILNNADPDWATRCVRSGLCSGEGLIWHIRDPITDSKKVTKKKNESYTEEVVDEGVADKRLLSIEEEFAQVLAAAGRRGSILATQLRQAWDSGRMEGLGKGKPAAVANPHVSVIAHSTEVDLARFLSRTDCLNGFGNRFLIICVRRSKLLPHGGDLNPEGLEPLLQQLRAAVSFAKGVGEIKRDAEANQIWEEFYKSLVDDGPGLSGALLARAAPHVMRLACIYALLGQSSQVRASHLRAALAFWDYCKGSVKHIFGEALGDPVADAIEDALQHAPAGLTREQINSGVCHRNKSSADISRALALLKSLGRAHCKKLEKVSQPGARPEFWYHGPGPAASTKNTK